MFTGSERGGQRTFALVGKREEKRSLGTRDPVEAKRRHAEALAEIELRWANLRSGPKVTEREAHQIAVVAHDRWLQLHLENPSKQTFWRIDLGDRLFKPKQNSAPYEYLYSLSSVLIETKFVFAKWKKDAWSGPLNGQPLTAFG